MYALRVYVAAKEEERPKKLKVGHFVSLFVINLQ